MARKIFNFPAVPPTAKGGFGYPMRGDAVGSKCITDIPMSSKGINLLKLVNLTLGLVL